MNLIQKFDEAGQFHAFMAGLGPLAEKVALRISQFAEDQTARRIWAHDPGLWAQDSSEQDEVRKRLGWIEMSDRSRLLLPDIARFVNDIQSAGFSHALLLGMGGATLAAEVLAGVFGVNEINGKPGLALQILDSTDPGQVLAAAKWSHAEDTLYIVASKSGLTVETNALLEYFWAKVHRRLGDKTGEHFIAITDPGTALANLAHQRKFRRVFLADPGVGGQYAALTAFGLVPAGLLGVDLDRLLKQATGMAKQCSAEVEPKSNAGLLLGAVLGESCLQGRDKMTIVADPGLAAFGPWLEQLVAESSGKQGKGILPVIGEPSVAPNQYGADRLFVYLRQDGKLDGWVNEMHKSGQPVIVMPIQDAYSLGSEFFRWEFATAAACAVLGVNGFLQPEVRDSKERTARRVKVFQETRRLDEGQAVWEGAGGRIYGWSYTGLNGARTLADAVRVFTEQSHAGDYIAINAFLPRNIRSTAHLQQLREYVMKVSGRATTLGFGPRFLHSTGQLHKGGDNRGLFLIITQDPNEMVEIPGLKMTFGTLERAQAVGDLESLLAKGRRAIRVHLVEGSINDLMT